MDIPDEVSRAITALEGAIAELRAGSWHTAGNTAGGKHLRSQAQSIVLAAGEVKQAVKRNTYSPR